MNKLKLHPNEDSIEIGCLDEEKRVIEKWEELTESTVVGAQNKFGYPRVLLTDFDYVTFGGGDVKASEWLARFKEEKELEGYKLRKEFEEYLSAVNVILGYPYDSDMGTTPDNREIEILKKAGVLDKWFNPVYEKEVYKIETDFGKHHARIAINDNIYEINSENIHEFLHSWLDDIGNEIARKEVGTIDASVVMTHLTCTLQVGGLRVTTNLNPRIDMELNWLIGVITREFNLKHLL